MKSSYVSPNAALAAGANVFHTDTASRGGARDLSQPVYTPWRAYYDSAGEGGLANYEVQQPAELLQALPWVKGSPVIATPATASKKSTIKVIVQADAPQAFGYTTADYEDGSTLTVGPTLVGEEIELPLLRIGLQVSGLKIDSAVAPAPSRDPSAWKLMGATNWLLMALGDFIANGAGGDLKGLSALAEYYKRVQVAPSGGTIDQLAASVLTKVSATGRGCGEGPHCLIGNETVLEELMVSPMALTNASSGWRHDPRTGLVVYHFLGIPYYRANLPQSSSGKHYLLAANLGPTGLNLVHAYGSVATYGLEVQQEPTNPATATQNLIVHGAYALALWDIGAIAGWKDIAFSSE